jgi:hypothetical protein
MNESTTEDAVTKVLEALANPSFRWRTLTGVAKETGLPLEAVQLAVVQASDRVIRSSVKSADGRDLFTTRDHFKSRASLPERLLGAIRNRAE